MSVTWRSMAGALATAAALAALASAPAALGKGKPEIVDVPPATLAFAQDWGCAGPVFTEFTLERRITSFYDGVDLVKEVRHVTWEGTLSPMTNGEPDRASSIPWGATVTFTFDFEAGTLTKTGRFRYSKADGGGLVVQDTGRTVESLETGDVSTDTAATLQEYEQAICAYLYGA